MTSKTRILIILCMGLLVIGVPSPLPAASSSAPPYDEGIVATSTVEDLTGQAKATATGTADASTGRLSAYAATAAESATGLMILPPQGAFYLRPLYGVGGTRARAGATIKQALPISGPGTFDVTVHLDSMARSTAVAVSPGPQGVYLSQGYSTLQIFAFFTCYWPNGSNYTFVKGDPYGASSTSIRGSVTCGNATQLGVEVTIEGFTEALGRASTSASILSRVASITVTS